MIRKTFFSFFLILVFLTASAQQQSRRFIQSLDSLREACETSVSSDTTTSEISPYYYRLLGPATYYSSATRSALSLKAPAPGDPVDNLNSAIDQQLLLAYASAPKAIHHYDAQFLSERLPGEVTDSRREALAKEVTQTLQNTVVDTPIDNLAGDVGDIGLNVVKPNFWKTSGAFSMQFTQNYFSENWYKGGNNNGTMLASLTLQANYDDQRHVTWENKLEMRLGFVSTTSDSCHTFLTNNDKLNLHSKLGIKATKSWYYSMTAEGNTQFMPGYKTNDRRTYSDFLAPLDVYVSIGMDFKPTLKNGNTFSVALLPLSYKFRYITIPDESAHKACGMVGKDFRQDFGSKIELNSKVKLAKDFTWKCRSYCFTSHEYVEAELENTFSYALSKYISTELYTLWRFDDNRPREFYDSTLGYFQFKEYFTLGLKYSF